MISHTLGALERSEKVEYMYLQEYCIYFVISGL